VTTASEKLKRIKETIVSAPGGWDDVVNAITDIVEEKDPTETDKYAPLMMGDTVIGRIKVNLETGDIDGHVSEGLAEILQDGLEGGILQVSFYGRATMPIVDAHARLKAYLEREAHK
jgi:hypothetical protein